MDQRGTGGSNQLACNLYGDKNDMAAFFGELFAPERLRVCRAELEKVADLKLYSTPVAMADLDEVRAALGYDKINLLISGEADPVTPPWLAEARAQFAAQFQPRRRRGEVK